VTGARGADRVAEHGPEDGTPRGPGGPEVPAPDGRPGGEDQDGQRVGEDVGAGPASARGRVYLVGAGPGDPGLLTLRGREVLARADVVVYDRLVDPAILQHCPPGCERIYAGKAPGRHALSQAEINRLLVERAARGLQVVRLKGGDPFVFGRGGEEAQALVATGIPFEVVPGVTSAVAVPAYAGIPVTHRDCASSFAVVTGHGREDGVDPGAVDWRAFGQQPDTLVVLMGRAGLATIAQALIQAGRAPTTPAAVISHGTQPRQRTVVADLQGIAAAAEDLPGPAVLVVGEVVRLRRQLQWFENRPLFGRRVVVTRTREQASELSAALRLLGAEPVELPVLRIRERPNPQDLEWCVTHLASFWWVCFTSAHAVGPFFAEVRRRGLDARALAGTRIACVGPATARALESHGLVADVVPPRATAADLVEALRPHVHAGQKALFVRGEPASDTLVVGLQALGLEVRQTIAYEALPDEEAAARAQELLADGADALTFASSATVGHFLEAAGEAGRALCARAKVVCIGPVTARAAEALGLRVDAVAPEASTRGLLQALLGLWAQEPARPALAGP
jgi:uroporphyrinogen III methyltransferase/synthase